MPSAAAARPSGPRRAGFDPETRTYDPTSWQYASEDSGSELHESQAEDARFRLELLARQSMRDLTVADLRSYIARVFDLVLVLRRLRSGFRSRSSSAS